VLSIVIKMNSQDAVFNRMYFLLVPFGIVLYIVFSIILIHPLAIVYDMSLALTGFPILFLIPIFI
jgi:hypothetical protein